MNTLSRAETSRLHEGGPGYDAVVAQWRRVASDPTARRSLTAAHHLLYAVLRGKDWRKGFSRATNNRKLENGRDPHQGPREALRIVHRRHESMLAPFADTVTRETLERVCAVLPWSKDPLDRDAYEALPRAA